MAVNDVLKAKVNLDVNGNTASVGFTYLVEIQTGGDNPCLALATEMSTQLMDFPITDLLASDVELSSIDVRQTNLTPDTPHNPAALFVRPYTAGQDTGESLPLTKAVVVRLLQTQNSGRHNGRQYWPGLSEAKSTTNVVNNATWLSDLREVLLDFRQLSTVFDGEDFTFKWIVENPLEVIKFPAVQDITVRPTIFSQRRRRTERRGVWA